MIVYWSASLISVVLIWIVTHIKQQNNICYVPLATIIAAFPLLIIAAVRYNVGADYIPYYQYYVDIINGVGQGRFELLYYELNAILAFWGLDPVWLFFACAVLFLIPIYVRILHDSPYPTISVFLLVGMTYYFYFLNGMRQMMAGAILLAGIPFIAERKFFPFAVIVLIATGFHATAIVFISLYFLARLHFGVKLLTGLTLAVFLFSQQIGDVANQFIAGIENYATYLDSIFSSRGQGYIVLCMNLLITAFCTVFYQKDNPSYKVYYTMQVISLWASALTGTIVLIDRFRMVFGLADIILIPMAIHQIPNRRIRIISAALIILLYFIYATYTVGVQNSNTVLPYQTIFD